MSDVEPAPAQLICGKGDCERANRLERALKHLRRTAETGPHVFSAYIISAVDTALKEDQ